MHFLKATVYHHKSETKDNHLDRIERHILYRFYDRHLIRLKTYQTYKHPFENLKNGVPYQIRTDTTRFLRAFPLPNWGNGTCASTN